MNPAAERGTGADFHAVLQHAIVLDQTHPTPRLRKAQALIAMGRTPEGDALLEEIVKTRWHSMWIGVPSEAQYLLQRGKPQPRIE